MIRIEPRASTVLFNFLRCSCTGDAPFILPTNICKDVYFTFLKAEVSVIFEDLEPENLGLDLERTVRRIEHESIQGILYNHTYGNAFTPHEAFHEIKTMHPALKIIDDRCLCVPSFEPERARLDLFDLVLFSTGYAKIAELNYGGIGLQELGSHYQQGRLPAQEDAYRALEERYADATHVEPELLRLARGQWLVTHPMEDPLESYRLKVESTLQKALVHKSKLNAIYAGEITPEAQLGEQYNSWRFQVVTEGKKQLLEEIFSEKLFASGHYESIGTKMNLGSFPVAEKLYASVVNLFNDHYFTIEQAQRLVNVIGNFAPK